VQGARRSSGLEVSDRISLWWQADGDVAQAVREHHELIAAEVLAVQVSEGAPDAANDAERVELDLGLSVWLQRRLP
jgi:isoleucyl-tRNA synthetase